ncbi:autotransporter assembly complex family protein [Poseidonocella sp. HB161398]|uniref:autotransporter assembly complex protein TamA n=1 Tax=Poseidonocella sp. HB161398 TaxID=2320855 RepID=UPI001108787C|nr:autotransporter assembly complex family protein [Poseidonocella sp. HB161398]
MQNFPKLGYAAGAVLACLAAPAFSLTAVEINVLGVSDSRAESLRDAMELASASKRALDEEVTDSQDIFAAALADYRQMVSVLYGEGYYGPAVSVLMDGREAAEVDPFAVPAEVQTITINVKPGNRFNFGRTSVEPREPGAAAAGEPLASGFVPGERARSALIGTAANAAISEWRDAGHAKADLGDQEITANHATSVLDVDIQVLPGPELRFGEVAIDGESGVRDKRLREILGLPTGELYSPQELNDAANRLRRTGTFRTVSLIEAEEPNPDGTLDYTLTVIDNPLHRFGVAAEYSTIDGALLSGFWLHRNLFGGAEQLRFDAEISNIGQDTTGLGNAGDGIDYSFGARISRPALFGPDNVAFAFADISLDDEPDYTEKQAMVGIGMTRYFSEDLLGEVALGYRYSYADDAFGKREFNHVALPSRLEWDRRDDEGDPTGGFFLRYRVTPMYGVNGSESLMQLDLDNRGYVSLGAESPVTLAGRMQIGSVIGADLDSTPPDFLFFSGGGSTVRGQDYQDLGATEFNGDTVGGRSFLGLSAEIRTRVTKSLGIVGFMDYGMVGTDSWVDEDSNYHSGVGLGVRYATPIGPIRVDIATPYQGPVDEFSRVDLYIGVGQAF